MAKRLFSTEIVDDDTFLSMNPNSQLAYFQLNMHTNELGFIEHFNRLGYLNITQASVDELIKNNFIIKLNDNAFAITHFKKMNNLKYKPKQSDLAKLVYTNENSEYCLKEEYLNEEEDDDCPFD